MNLKRLDDHLYKNTCFSISSERISTNFHMNFFLAYEINEYILGYNKK